MSETTNNKHYDRNKT